MSSAHPPALTLDEVVARLTPAIGAEKSREVVASAARTLGSFDANAVLKALEEDAGVVGLAARSARTRISVLAGASMPAQPGAEQAPKRTIPCRAVTDLLAHSLGEEASAELVQTTLRRLGIEGAELDMRKALRLLEALAAVPGLVGISARFVKARVILLF